jgi:transketolase
VNTQELAKRIRIHSINMTHISRGSHIASALSIADIIAVLYGSIMKIYPDDPNNCNRDRFILSKGHAGAAVYAALAEVGFFSVEELKTHYSNGSRLSGHVSHKNVPGVEVSTGSLGHGVCIGAGMAMAAKIDNKQHHIYVVVGDGECNEGSVWEMALFANHFRLNNFTVIVDHNKMQSLDTCENTLEYINLAEKWRTLGWNVLEVDGHNHNQLINVLLLKSENKPTCIIAHTIKGKGVSFMENNILWHYRDPQGEFYEKALQELEAL